MSKKVKKVVKTIRSMSDDTLVELTKTLYGYDDPWWRAVVATNIERAETVDKLLSRYDGKRDLD